MKIPHIKTQWQKLLQQNNISQTSHKFPQDTDIPYYKYIKCSTKDTIKLNKLISTNYLSTIPQSKSCIALRQIDDDNCILFCKQKHYGICKNCCDFYMRYRYDSEQFMFVLLEYQNVHIHYQMSVEMKAVRGVANQFKINCLKANTTMKFKLRSYNQNNQTEFEEQQQYQFEEER